MCKPLESTHAFSAGTVSTLVSLRNQETYADHILDRLLALVDQMIMNDIILAGRWGVTDEGTSEVSQEVTYQAHGHEITVSVRLVVQKAGIEQKLSRLLAHRLVELHQLPAMLHRWLTKPTAPLGSFYLVDSMLFSAFASPEDRRRM